MPMWTLAKRLEWLGGAAGQLEMWKCPVHLRQALEPLLMKAFFAFGCIGEATRGDRHCSWTARNAKPTCTASKSVGVNYHEGAFCLCGHWRNDSSG
ncbi:hypothetical protein [Cytobacillus sp. IB215665]|uniref:hypothetical protein n=1 Tax=Cytobacillus sp. IB215665 TaxID=3097357 RepID=UPI002A15EC2A|nr:hypothetical protein [Cytobacillus sp. IB215665]MDX8367452.1 hypothetical protein [Cytobacillus sp. IB215665]